MTMILTGDLDIDRRLRSLAGARGKAVVRSASRKALKPVATAVKSFPWPQHTGKMAAHIRQHTKVKALGRSKAHRGMIGSRVSVIQHQTKGGKEVLNQGEVFYLGFHELGYTHYLAGKQEPKNWLKGIGESHRTAVQAEFRKLLHEKIEAELRKQQGRG